jgi:hypothetical protein
MPIGDGAAYSEADFLSNEYPIAHQKLQKLGRVFWQKIFLSSSNGLAFIVSAVQFGKC